MAGSAEQVRELRQRLAAALEEVQPALVSIVIPKMAQADGGDWLAKFNARERAKDPDWRDYEEPLGIPECITIALNSSAQMAGTALGLKEAKDLLHRIRKLRNDLHHGGTFSVDATASWLHQIYEFLDLAMYEAAKERVKSQYRQTLLESLGGEGPEPRSSELDVALLQPSAEAQEQFEETALHETATLDTRADEPAPKEAVVEAAVAARRETANAVDRRVEPRAEALAGGVIDDWPAVPEDPAVNRGDNRDFAKIVLAMVAISFVIGYFIWQYGQNKINAVPESNPWLRAMPFTSNRPERLNTIIATVEKFAPNTGCDLSFSSENKKFVVKPGSLVVPETMYSEQGEQKSSKWVAYVLVMNWIRNDRTTKLMVSAEKVRALKAQTGLDDETRAKLEKAYGPDMSPPKTN